MTEITLMLLSQIHIKAHLVTATYDNFHEIEWDVAISWQLQGLCGCYGVWVCILFANIALHGS